VVIVIFAVIVLVRRRSRGNHPTGVRAAADLEPASNE
jgi:hypothetical protein